MEDQPTWLERHNGPILVTAVCIALLVPFAFLGWAEATNPSRDSETAALVLALILEVGMACAIPWAVSLHNRAFAKEIGEPYPREQLITVRITGNRRRQVCKRVEKEAARRKRKIEQMSEIQTDRHGYWADAELKL